MVAAASPVVAQGEGAVDLDALRALVDAKAPSDEPQAPRPPPPPRPDLARVDTPSAAALLLLEMAAESEVQVDQVRVRWNPLHQVLDVVMLVDTELWRLTPFLYLASGPTDIVRMGQGREVSFPMPLRAQPTAPGPLQLGRLARVLDRPGYLRRQVQATSIEGRLHQEVQVRAPVDAATALLADLDEALGVGAITEVEIEAGGDRARVRAACPANGDKPGGAGRVELGSWGAASGDLEAGRLHAAFETGQGKIYGLLLADR